MIDILLEEFDRIVDEVLIDYTSNSSDELFEFTLLKKIIDNSTELFGNTQIQIILKLDNQDSRINISEYNKEKLLNNNLYILLSTLVIKLDTQFNSIKLNCTISELFSYKLSDIYEDFLNNISNNYDCNFNFGYSTIIGRNVQKLSYNNFKIFISEHFFTELKTVDKILRES
jgi:hypothetical protein